MAIQIRGNYDGATSSAVSFTSTDSWRDLVGRVFGTHTRQNVARAFAFNGLGVPLAATGLLYPVWAMAAMAVSVTAIFANSLWGRPALLFDAVRSVGHHPESEPVAAGEARVAE